MVTPCGRQHGAGSDGYTVGTAQYSTVNCELPQGTLLWGTDYYVQRCKRLGLAAMKKCVTIERVTGNRGRGQENQNIKLSIWTTAKNSTVLGVSEHAESIGLAIILASPFLS